MGRMMHSDKAEGAQDRRRYMRFSGDGMMVMIQGRIYPVADLSLGGLRVICDLKQPPAYLQDLRMIPVSGEAMKLGAAVQVTAQVLSKTAGALRLAFDDVSPEAVRLIGDHIRRCGTPTRFGETPAYA